MLLYIKYMSYAYFALKILALKIKTGPYEPIFLELRFESSIQTTLPMIVRYWLYNKSLILTNIFAAVLSQSLSDNIRSWQWLILSMTFAFTSSLLDHQFCWYIDPINWTTWSPRKAFKMFTFRRFLQFKGKNLALSLSPLLVKKTCDVKNLW
jgi:hypothetical protein